MHQVPTLVTVCSPLSSQISTLLPGLQLPEI